MYYLEYKYMYILLIAVYKIYLFFITPLYKIALREQQHQNHCCKIKFLWSLRDYFLLVVLEPFSLGITISK